MATIQQLETALVNADRAGDVQAATQLAAEITRLRGAGATEITPPTAPAVAPAAAEPRYPDVPYFGPEGGVEFAGEQPVTPEPDRDVGEVITGVGEAGLSMVTGVTGGTAGMVYGTFKGLADAIRSGKYGTAEGADMVEKAALDMMQQLTYQPRTEAGAEYTRAVGEVLEETIPVMPLTAEMAAISQATRAAAPIAGAVVRRTRAPGEVPEAPQPRVEPTMGAAVERPIVEPPITPERPAMPPVAETPQDVGALINKAAKGGMGAAKAQDELATAARVNPEAKLAADNLGIDLPADVLSDSQMIREAAGLTRSVAGSEASAAWRENIIKWSDQADETIRTLDASPDMATVSHDVLSGLGKTQSELGKQAREIYNKVDAVVPKTENVDLANLRSTMDTIISEVGEKGLTTQEKALMKMMDEGNITYGRMLREKSLIGKALEQKDSPYGNMDAGSLKRLYGALKEDQLYNVEQLAGSELRDNLRLANQITAKKKALEKRIINAFGQESDGSIAGLLRRSVQAGAKGDIAPLNKLLKVIPEDLKKEAIATALMSTTRAAGGLTTGGFGFAEFAKTYRGLRQNAPIYNKVVEILGKDIGKDTAHQLLNNLYTVSKRVTDARANVLTTGKANQALVEAMRAEGLMSKVLESTTGRAATTGAAAVSAGPIGAGLASGLMHVITTAKKDPIKAAGNLFKSDEFNQLAKESATKTTVSPKTVKRFTNSPAFKRWQKAANIVIDNPELWVMQSMQMQQQETE